MSDINEAQHPQEPAEGPDFDEQQADEQNAQREQQGATDAQQQNEERELNNGDAFTQPGGDEPSD